MPNYLRLFIELRRRLLHVLMVFCLLLGLSFYWAPILLHGLMLPLLNNLPRQHHLIATQLTTPLLTPLYLACHVALLGMTPYALYQLWRFVIPALHPVEQRHLQYILCLCVGLFVMGNLFCYFCILPCMLRCIVLSVPKDVLFMPDIAYAAGFMLKMMGIFGLSFQVPLVCKVMVRLQLMRRDTLKELRPYVIVAAFTLGMLLTPPDVVSQILLAIPLWGLYEAGLLLTRS